jgi:hypothetical protein
MDGSFDNLVDPTDLPFEPEAAPRIAVSSRVKSHKRWRFLPPLALCLIACGVLAVRLKSRDWQGLSMFITRGWSPPRRVATAPAALPGPRSEVLETAIVAETPALPWSHRIPTKLLRAMNRIGSAEGPSPRVRVPRPDAIPGLPPVIASTFAPQMGAQREAKLAWEEIRQEAEQRRAEREQMEALIPTVEAQQIVDQERGDADKTDRARQRAETDRVPYREALRKAIDRHGDDAGPTIRALAGKHVTKILDDDKKDLIRALKEHAGRLDRNGRVALYRSFGLPEASILETLALAEVRNFRARNGPKNLDDAYVRAARQLLAVPLETPSPPPPQAANSSGRGRPGASR